MSWPEVFACIYQVVWFGLTWKKISNTGQVRVFFRRHGGKLGYPLLFEAIYLDKLVWFGVSTLVYIALFFESFTQTVFTSRESRSILVTPSDGLFMTIYTKLTLSLDVYERFHADFRPVSGNFLGFVSWGVRKLSMMTSSMMCTKLSEIFFLWFTKFSEK